MPRPEPVEEPDIDAVMGRRPADDDDDASSDDEGEDFAAQQRHQLKNRVLSKVDKEDAPASKAVDLEEDTPYDARRIEVICEACRAGNAFQLNQHLDLAGTNVNAFNTKGEAALHCAAQAGSAPCVRALLAAKAELDQKDRKGATPLLRAAQAADSSARGTLDAVKALLEAGADANAAGEGGQTPLLEAASRGPAESVALLLAKKADPNLASERQSTPLHEAAFADAAQIVSSLLAGRADPGALNGRGKTPLEVAQRLGNDEIVKLFERDEEERDATLDATYRNS